MASGAKGSSTSVNGTHDLWQAAQRLRTGEQALLYFREDGEGYLIRDRALLQRAEQIHAPQRRLGEQQGELGRRQGELGARQGQLGVQQGRLGARMHSASARQTADLGREISALGSQQSALGKQQAALGAEQARLGEEQRRLSEIAQQEMRELISDARARNLVERVG